jgi:hypothetical protein
MRKFSPEQKQSFDTLSRQYPEFGEFLREWRQQELEAMVHATKENLDVLRGRVQTLTELSQGLFGRGISP